MIISQMTAAIDFVRATTEPHHPPLVPEIRLHLASEVVPLWRKTEEELAQEGVPPPYWAFAWAGGQALARYILDTPMTLGSVLDFGAGSGLVAIAAAKAGASAVLAADIDAFATAAMMVNAADNNVVIETTTEDVIGRAGDWNTILVGDMCYERPLAERLLAWLTGLARNGALVLIGDPGRSYFPKSGVTKLATYAVPVSLDLEDREIRETSVYRLMP